jgi:hypothetical protein
MKALVSADPLGGLHNQPIKRPPQPQTRSVDFRAGIEVDTDGTYTLVVWLPLSASGTVLLEVGQGE